MSEPAHMLATEEDFLALGDAKAELISGEILMAPSALGKHGLWQVKLAVALDKYSRKSGGPRGPGGWQILLEVDIRFRPGLILRPQR